MVRYEVVYVGGDDLPEAQDWAIVQTGTETFLFVKESEVSADLLTAVWCGWQRVNAGEVASPRRSFARV